MPSQPGASEQARATQVRIETAKDRYFKGDGYTRHEDASFADCEALCLRERRCQALEYVEKERVCRLYAAPETALESPGTTVGYKRGG